MDKQPWIYPKNPIGHVWVADLIEAVENGFITLQEVREHVNKGWVRPSLAYQVEQKIADARKILAKVEELDRHYIAPYQKIVHLQRLAAAKAA